MLIERTIGSVKIAVDPAKGNSIYFHKDTGISIPNSSISFTSLSNRLYELDKEPRPYVVLWELLSSCNYNCPFCYIHTSAAKTPLLRWSDGIKQDIDDLIDMGMIACTLSGGEPLLHPDFPVIYRYLKEKGVIVRVFSNLSMITPALEDLFVELPPFKLEVSLYGCDDNSYTLTTAQDKHTFSEVTESILRLRLKGVNVICKTALNALTVRSLLKMKLWCEENRVPYFFSYDLQPKYCGDPNDCFALSEMEEYEAFKCLHPINTPVEDSVIAPKELFECGAGKTGCMIDYTYNVRPCMRLYTSKKCCIHAEFGHLKDAVTKMTRIVESLRGKTNQYCSGCNAKGVCRVCTADALDDTSEHVNIAAMSKCKKTRDLFNRLLKESNTPN